MIQILLWWLAAQILGWLALPTAFSLFRWLPDRGYSFSKILGLLLAAYFLWLGASMGALRNDTGGVLAALLLLAALSAIFLLRRIRPRGESILAFLRERTSLILAAEGLFTLSFVFWSLLRAYASFKIQPAGGEKFMEIAFLNGVLNSPTFPALDPWLSGFAISYYHFGYVMMAFLTRLTGALPEVAFDLYDALIFALTLLGAFGVVSNLVAGSKPQINADGRRSESPPAPLDKGGIPASPLSQGGTEGGFLLPPLPENPPQPPLIRGEIPASPLSQGGIEGGFLPPPLPENPPQPPLIRGEIPASPLPKGGPRGDSFTTSHSPLTTHLLYGLLGALLLGVMGNLEGLLESLLAKGWLPKSFAAWIDIPDLVNAPVTGSFDPTGPGWFWWWRASRVIQDVDLAGQKLGVSPITEFPFFSFLLGDNHPHKMALPFVLLCIALSLNLFRRQLSLPPAGVQGWGPAEFAFGGDWGLFLLTALGLGSLGFLNTWDMPIYIGLAVLAYAAGRWLRRGRLDGETVLRSLVSGLWLGLASLLLYGFFYLSFSSQAGGILPYIYPPTRLPQYLVMFGPFVWISAWFLAAYWAARSREAAQPIPLAQRLLPILRAWGWVAAACIALLGLGVVMALVTAGGFSALQASLTDPAVQQTLGGLTLREAAGQALLARLQNPWLFLVLSLGLALVAANFLRSANRSPAAAEVDAGLEAPASDPTPATEEMYATVEVPATDPTPTFVLLLLLVGIALTFSVEFFYLRDQFGLRMNTVFKFYYQGWVLLALGSAYGAWWLLNPGRAVLGSAGRAAFQVLTALIVAAGLVYPVLGAWNRANGFAGPPDLNAASEIARDHPDDWAAIEWLRANAGQDGTVPVILEAPAGSYQYEGRISAFTGFPTVLGWALHEAQWRGTYDEQARREPDIQAIYTRADARQTLDLLHKWGVRYVILGSPELVYIEQQCAQPGSACSLSRSLGKFESTLPAVFQQGSTTIYAVP